MLPLLKWLTDWLIDWLIDWLTDWERIQKESKNSVPASQPEMHYEIVWADHYWLLLNPQCLISRKASGRWKGKKWFSGVWFLLVERCTNTENDRCRLSTHTHMAWRWRMKMKIWAHKHHSPVENKSMKIIVVLLVGSWDACLGCRLEADFLSSLLTILDSLQALWIRSCKTTTWSLWSAARCFLFLDTTVG